VISKTKRTTIDINPDMKERISVIANKSRLPVTLALEVILEKALPKYESGEYEVAATTVQIKSEKSI